MSLKDYQTWSPPPERTQSPAPPHYASNRLRSPGVIDLFHEPKFVVSKSSEIFTIGSCFARRIEDALVAKDFVVNSAKIVPPAGSYRCRPAREITTRFNTSSMLTELEVFLENRELPDHGLIEMENGLFWNPMVHKARPSEMPLARQLIDRVRDMVRTVMHSDLVVITLGLTEYWFDKVLAVPLNDPPAKDWTFKGPADRFEIRNETFEEAYQQVDQLTQKIFKHGKDDVRIVLTVSPVPLLRTFTNQDIIVANSYSKSTLRSVAERISQQHDRIDYFPSYEMAVNSPRSTTWEPDMRHVSPAFVEAIVAKFENTYFERG